MRGRVASQRHAAPEANGAQDSQKSSPASRRGSRQYYALQPPALPGLRVPPDGSGGELPAEIRRDFQQQSGHDVSDVRVHSDTEPRKVQAVAYTRGSHIHFMPGRYEPHSSRGRAMILHELRHVAQQREGRARRPDDGGLINTEQKLEAEADRGLGEPARPASASRVSAEQAPVQRIIQKADGSDYSHAELQARPWYKALSVSDQLFVNQHHGHQNRYSFETMQQKLKQRSGSWKPPAAPNQYPITQKKMQAMRQTRYGEAVVEDGDLPKPADDRQAYHARLLKLLDDSRQQILGRGWGDAVSSDSDEEVAGDAAAQERRRSIKADYLTGLTQTFQPLTSQESEFADRLRDHRMRDAAAHDGGTGPVYAEDTRRELAQVGDRYRLTSMEHNPYLRRAFRRAVPADAVQAGGAAKYNQYQGNIRERLRAVLEADHAKMQWKSSDFRDDATWQAVEHMRREGISNASTGDTYADRVAAGADPAGSSTRTAFHHIAWKEADADFGPHALNPANLTAMNDQRDLLNPKKRAAAEMAGALPVPGDHDIFGHQSQGFRSDQRQAFPFSRGGGQFKDIDKEATFHVAAQTIKPRVSKRTLYSVDTTAPAAKKQQGSSDEL